MPRYSARALLGTQNDFTKVEWFTMKFVFNFVGLGVLVFLYSFSKRSGSP